jgi:multidrug efflux pump subunit AcrA (membrane-fusion protein)
MPIITGLVPRGAARAAAASILAALDWACSNGKAAPPPPPATVVVVDVVKQDVPLRTEWVTTLDGYVNARIRPQVTGYLVKQNYVEGSYVKKGEVLFEIDPRPFQAALDQARGQVAQAEAQLRRAARDVERDIPLAEARAIARSQLDTDTQVKLAAAASVDSARAAVKTAQLNLEFTKLRSLTDGIAGIAQGQIGDLVVPQRAVTELQGGYQVAVVGNDNKVAIRAVKVGARFGSLWVIEDGVAAGDKVVAEGIQKVRDGLPVTPVPFRAQAQAPAKG